MARGNGRKTSFPLNYVKAHPMLHGSAFMSEILPLSMESPSSSPYNPVPIQDETGDSAELPRGISDIAVRYLLTCIELR